MPEPSASPQPKRHRRFWLWAPYVAVLAALVAWSGVWLAMSLRTQSELNDRAKALRARGYAASWSGMKVDGWPFRLDLTLTQPRFGEPSGWAVAAPVLKGESMPYTPGRWILVAPEGLTLTRPGKGPLAVAGRAIRASVGGLDTPQPRFSFEGLDLSLSPAPGGQPTAFSAADRLEMHLQPGPDDQAALLVRVEDAKLEPSTNLARLATTLDLTWDSRLSHLSALRGRDWPSAVQAWTAAGGAMTMANAKIALGGLALEGAGGSLTVGPDGRLRGAAPMTVRKGGGLNLGGLHLGGVTVGGLSFSGPMPLKFEDGRVWFGAFPIGPALKVY
ncbi:MAG: hypothetical protein JWO72_1677 [Caulobacteraceae bacterium]|nr:hypothetical protein [Caulobacteraceae bacterium]